MKPMTELSEIFNEDRGNQKHPDTHDETFSQDEVRLANRNAGTLLDTLHHEITPTGLHYLLTHFDVPDLDADTHTLQFLEGFKAPFSLDLSAIEALPQIDMPVTLECAGNGRAGISPRAHSMPWHYEAVGTSIWTGTPLRPLIERAQPERDTIDIVFTGADEGFDKGIRHHFGRSLNVEQIQSLDVMLVHRMNGQPLLPQHGAPFRLIVPGWYGMASVKWLSRIDAINTPYQGFQQVNTYRYRKHKDEAGIPVSSLRVKSLMQPPGIPDWKTRVRYVQPGRVTISGKAWSGNGTAITKLEFDDGSGWNSCAISPPTEKYAWTAWSFDWQATPGDHMLRCRATDANGNVQPEAPPWDASGFGNNAVQQVPVHVSDKITQE
ncbi:MAG: molybdopterin-dependent oxidoreductase [Granulosicoccus sp.]|nr:molybdopterin-dependent oxidoreductase [Granulosicoccus sp.]